MDIKKASIRHKKGAYFLKVPKEISSGGGSARYFRKISEEDRRKMLSFLGIDSGVFDFEGRPITFKN